ncbi:sulfate adenylyltransferase [Bacillus sp. NRRL B-14911]|nr:sulfate adenylyltransferase [Bacillus sp. NRRL B-14911]
MKLAYMPSAAEEAPFLLFFRGLC